MKPLNGFIIIQLIDTKITSGGILIPDDINSKPVWEGTVLSVGDGVLYKSGVKEPYEMDVYPSDIVYFLPSSARQLNPNTKTYLIHHDHLIGVMKADRTNNG